MKVELSAEEMGEIVGGAAYVNRNTGNVFFSKAGKCFKMKGTADEVATLCRSLIGHYATDEEFDAACIAALESKGWI